MYTMPTDRCLGYIRIYKHVPLHCQHSRVLKLYTKKENQMKNAKKHSRFGIRTQVTRFRVWGANHYTNPPSHFARKVVYDHKDGSTLVDDGGTGTVVVRLHGRARWRNSYPGAKDGHDLV